MRGFHLAFGIALIAISKPALAEISQYDCRVQTPTQLKQEGEAVSLGSIGFPFAPDDWTFGIRFVDRGKNKVPKAVIETSGKDPFSFAGDQQAIPTGRNSYAIPTVSAQRCLFTSGACATSINFAWAEDGHAKVIILPVALWTDEKTQMNTPFVALAFGDCTKRPSK